MPVRLAVTSVQDTRSSIVDSEDVLTPELITLDPNADMEHAERVSWMLVEDDYDVRIKILDEGEKAPKDTISQIYESPRHGQVIGPAVFASGKGLGGQFRVRVFLGAEDDEGDEDDEDNKKYGSLELEICADPDHYLPETTVTIATLSAYNHVLPLLEGGTLDLAKLYNFHSVVLGGNSNKKTEHVACLRYGDSKERTKHVGYLDRIAVFTSPPARFVFERSADVSEKAGRDGALMLVNGMNDYCYIDDGKVLDAFVAAQPPRTNEMNRDLVRALSDKGQPLQASDMSAATEITAAVYSKIASLISTEHGVKASQLLPRDVNQYLSAPSYFGLISSSPNTLFTLSAPRKLNQAVAQGDEKKALLAYCGTAMQGLMRDNPSIKPWFDIACQSDAVYIAALIPFYNVISNVLEAGIDPVGIDI